MTQQFASNLCQPIRELLNKHYHLLLLFQNAHVFPCEEDLIKMEELPTDVQTLQKHLKEFSKLYRFDDKATALEMVKIDEEFQAIFLNFKKLILERKRVACHPVACNYISTFYMLFRSLYEFLLQESEFSSKGKNQYINVASLASTSCAVSTHLSPQGTGPVLPAIPQESAMEAVTFSLPENIYVPSASEDLVGSFSEGPAELPQDEWDLPPCLEEPDLNREEQRCFSVVIRFNHTNPCIELLSYRGKLYGFLLPGLDKVLMKRIPKKEDTYKILAELCGANWREVAAVVRRYRNPESNEADSYVIKKDQFQELKVLIQEELLKNDLAHLLPDPNTD